MQLNGATTSSGRYHVVNGTLSVERFDNLLSEVVRNLAPYLYRHAATLRFCQKTVREVLLLSSGSLAAGAHKFFFGGRRDDVRKRPGDPCVRRIAETERFYLVEDARQAVEFVVRHKVVD